MAVFRRRMMDGGRRKFLRDIAALGAAAAVPARAARGTRLRFVALGQAAIQHDLREHPYEDYQRIASMLRGTDVCFTDLETVIEGPGAGPSTRNTGFFKAAQPAVLDCLKDFSVNLLALSNNHSWEADFHITPAWQRRWARQCIDAGACAFISHGAPLLQGIELYRGRPIFHDLGSIVFHTRTKVGYYPPEVWESAIAACTFDAGQLVSLELTPILLNESGLSEADFHETRGRPSIARGEAAARVLKRVQEISPRVEIRVTGDVGRLVL